MQPYLPNPNRYQDMQYRRCGRSGLKLPAVSLGLWHNFGHVDVLEAEAQRRLAANPGDRYRFPRGTLMRADNGGAPVTDRAGHEAPVAHYRDEIYGEEILGSTQCRMLAGVPFDLLGLPEDVPTTSYASITEGIQHTLYRYMVAPMLLLGGLVVFAYRSSRRHRPEDWD